MLNIDSCVNITSFIEVDSIVQVHKFYKEMIPELIQKQDAHAESKSYLETQLENLWIFIRLVNGKIYHDLVLASEDNITTMLTVNKGGVYRV